MNKFITKIFKSAGVKAMVSKDASKPKFKVVENKLTLEGTVTKNRYMMTIKDVEGKSIDNLSVVISNSNDIVNRINESIQTLHLLSDAYDKKKLREDEEEFDTVEIDEEEPTDINTGLDDLYTSIIDVAAQAEELTDIVPEDDAEQINTIISFASSLYACAIDVDDYIEDLKEEAEEDIDESVSRKVSKSDVNKVLESLTLAEAHLRRNANYSDIRKAIKDIKAELIVRSK